MARRLFLALATIVWPAITHASPRADPTTGRAVFTGATLPSATSIGLNPAALGLGVRTEYYFAATSVLEQFGIKRRQIDLATGDLIPADTVDDVAANVGGNFAALWRPSQAGRTTLAFEVRLPPPELFPDAESLRYHHRGSRQRNYILSGGVGFRVSSRFYFGVSVSHDITDLDLNYSRDTALDPAVGIDADCGGARCGLENPLASEEYRVDVRSERVSGENLRVNLGILMRVFRDTWIGLAYHNTPGFGIQSQLDGNLVVVKAPRDGGAVLRGESSVLVSYPASVDGEIRTPLRYDLDLHIGGRWEDLSRMQGYDVRAYGKAFLGQNVPEWTQRPRGFRDSFAMWAGVEQVERNQEQHRFRFGGRVGFETPALQDDRTAPGSMAPTSLTFDAGVQIRISPALSLQLSYGLQAFARIDVTSSDYDPRFALDCQANGFDYTTPGCAAVREGYAIPTADGEYTRLSHALRIGLRYERL